MGKTNRDHRNHNNPGQSHVCPWLQCCMDTWVPSGAWRGEMLMTRLADSRKPRAPSSRSSDREGVLRLRQSYIVQYSTQKKAWCLTAGDGRRARAPRRPASDGSWSRQLVSNYWNALASASKGLCFCIVPFATGEGSMM